MLPPSPCRPRLPSSQSRLPGGPWAGSCALLRGGSAPSAIRARPRWSPSEGAFLRSLVTLSYVIEIGSVRYKRWLGRDYPENGLGVLSTSSISSGSTKRPQTSQKGLPPPTLTSWDLQTLWMRIVSGLLNGRRNSALPYQIHAVRTRLCPHLGHLSATEGEGQKLQRHLASDANASFCRTSQESHISVPS